MNQLEQLQQFSTIVADTGDIASIRRLKPQDATTNPSLILKAASQPEYEHIIRQGLDSARRQPDARSRLQDAVEAIAVGFGVEILHCIPRLVSTEAMPANLSTCAPPSNRRAVSSVVMNRPGWVANGCW